MLQICTPQELADNIRTAAQRRNVTIADMLRTLQIGHNLITKITNGAYPRLDTIAKIAAFLECSIDVLIYRQE